MNIFLEGRKIYNLFTFLGGGVKELNLINSFIGKGGEHFVETLEICTFIARNNITRNNKPKRMQMQPSLFSYLGRDEIFEF